MLVAFLKFLRMKISLRNSRLTLNSIKTIKNLLIIELSKVSYKMLTSFYGKMSSFIKKMVSMLNKSQKLLDTK